MKQRILLNTVIAMTLIGSSAAVASDYESGIVSKTPGGDTTPVEFGSGWYLRGDIGTAFMGDGEFSFNRAARAGDVNAESSADYTIGVGFGYIFNDHLRADVTFDYVGGGAWSGSGSGCGVDGVGIAYTGSCSSADGGSFESRNAVVNAYVNLGTFGGFTPYVGAGFGVASVELSGTRSVARCTLDPGETCDIGTHSGGATAENFTSAAENFNTEESMNFVYSLMAGLDYRIDQNWTADIGYRYTNIVADDQITSLTSATTIQFDGVELHEVRAGLRYEIW